MTDPRPTRFVPVTLHGRRAHARVVHPTRAVVLARVARRTELPPRTRSAGMLGSDVGSALSGLPVLRSGGGR